MVRGSEFYYDGKIMMALAPAENLVAVADAPPTIDAALAAAYTTAAIYFPFTDVIVADPYKDLADGLKHAFYIGQSTVVASHDHGHGGLPDRRCVRAGLDRCRGSSAAPPVRDFPQRSAAATPRAGTVQLALRYRRGGRSVWIPQAATAKHIAFAAPDAKPSGMQPPPKSQTGKAKSGSTP